MKKSATIAVAVLIVVLAVAGGLYFATRPATRQITLQAYDFIFTESGVTGNNPTITVNSGDTIVLTVQNLGAKDHEFFVLTQSDYNSYINALTNGLSADEPLPAFEEASVEDILPGQSKTGTFVAGQPGMYVYACLDKDGTEPLVHAHRGMFGTFQVNSGGILGLTGAWAGRLMNVPAIYLFQVYLIAALTAVTTFYRQTSH